MQVSIRSIGNSKGLVIPKPFLHQLGLEDTAEVTIEAGALVVRPPKKILRQGWAEAAQRIASQGDDVLVLGEFEHAADQEWVW